MNISFLGQGIEPESKNSVGNQIIRLFQENKFNMFTGISAFASEAGVNGLSECIDSGKDFIKTLNLIVGIDQEGTSIEALQEINNLNINSYIFYQKEAPIFHPKIYLFEGVSNTAIIVGSSNLTARGLFGNVESSLLLEFENDNPMGLKVLKELKDYHRSLFEFSDPNLFKISTETINQFVDEGIVPTHKIWNKKHGKNTSETVPENKNKIDIPKRATAKIPATFKGRYRTNKTVSKIITELEISNDFESENTSLNEIVWKSGALTERDLNIPKGANTSATGSMLFKKGTLANINPRHYFRDDIFKSLQWVFDTRANRTHLERANANVRLIILGVDYEIFSLKISHNTNSEHLESVKQPATQLHWGETKRLIAQEELIGKTASLYKTTTESDEFTLIIE